MKPLAEYKRKRDFRLTREPSGAKAKRGRKGKGLTFVIQEHHASHLHYDFRLEWDGVLKSWAVPKGPSLDPKQRRLAVQVEDHPLDYATFTGTIPKGEYGAGEVYRWDMGTWTPGNDPDEGLRKGRLEFALEGGKLHGGWLLVRTRATSGTKTQWLLIKRHDQYAEEGVGKVEALPDYVKPQLAQLVTRPPTGPDWVHEIKFDGYRIQAHIEKGRVRLYTRRGHDWTTKYKSLAKALAGLDVENAIVDGEVVWQDEKGHSSFQKLQNAMKAESTEALVYWAFDLLYLDGKSLMSLPLIARKDRLQKLISRLDRPHVRYSEHFRESGEQLLKAMCKMELEGVISKRADRPYASGRRDDWTKTKCSRRQEFVIGGFTEARGSRHGFGSLLLGVYQSGEFTYVGKVGTGFDQRGLESMYKKLLKVETKTSPFVHKPPGRNNHWVKPKMVAEVSFSEWTADRHLRVPVFHALRADKAPEQITVEIPKEVIADHVVEKHRPAKPRAPIKALTGIPRVTHPDRMIYAKEKLTKLDVAKFYQAVALWMVPHIADRPLSLLRCTDSAIKGCFFNKHFPTKLPKSLIAVPEKGKAPFFAIDSAEGLATLIQYGALEIHPWNCHRQDIEAPDQIVLDFDPGPEVDFETVKEGAVELRDLLAHLGLKSWLKVTGGKGLHVQFPFEPAYDWETVKNFSKTLVLEMVSRHPDLYTANMAKKARSGKIFLDYLRNGRGATAIAPYSLRARETSAVAMPIAWSELGKLKASNQFTLAEALKYLKKRKMDPWRDYFKTSQKIDLLN
ncbi:MAG: DNA ligase D [Bdellovibrionales bacterium]|nr:DNA ligase D [Bdellovibrionales bacterium]